MTTAAYHHHDDAWNKNTMEEQHLIQSKRLLFGLQTASNPAERRSVLKLALIAFNHDIQGIHDEEICQAEAPTVLYKCLVKTLQQQKDHNNNDDASSRIIKEAARICQLLYMVYGGCSDTVAIQSLRDIASDLLPILLLQLPFLDNNSITTSAAALQMAAENLIRRVASLGMSLVGQIQYCDKLLLCLVRILRTKTPFEMNNWTVWQATYILAGLSTHPDSKVLVFQYPGLVQAAIDRTTVTTNNNISSSAAATMYYDANVRQEVAKVLCNLAWDTRNKAVMVQTKHNKIVETLVTLSKDQEDSSSLPATRIHAMMALKHLSVDAGNKAPLVNHDKGAVVRALMDVIMEEHDDNSRLADNHDNELRVASMGTLCNLVCAETYKDIGRQPGLLARLASIVVSSCTINNNSTKKDSSSLVLAELAAQTVKKLATYIPLQDKCHESLFQALVEMSSISSSCGDNDHKHDNDHSSQASSACCSGSSSSTTTTTLLWTCKAFVQQSLISGCSFYMARFPSVLNILSQLALHSHARIRACSLEALSNLAQDAANARKLAANSQLLEALIEGADGTTECPVAEESARSKDNADAQRHAVKAILCLASHRSTSKRVAKQLGLVASLSRYGISKDDDVELKRAAIKGVLLLAPLL